MNFSPAASGRSASGRNWGLPAVFLLPCRQPRPPYHAGPAQVKASQGQADSQNRQGLSAAGVQAADPEGTKPARGSKVVIQIDAHHLPAAGRQQNRDINHLHHQQKRQHEQQHFETVSHTDGRARRQEWKGLRIGCRYSTDGQGLGNVGTASAMQHHSVIQNRHSRSSSPRAKSFPGRYRFPSAGKRPSEDGTEGRSPGGKGPQRA